MPRYYLKCYNSRAPARLGYRVRQSPDVASRPLLTLSPAAVDSVQSHRRAKRTDRRSPEQSESVQTTHYVSARPPFSKVTTRFPHYRSAPVFLLLIIPTLQKQHPLNIRTPLTLYEFKSRLYYSFFIFRKEQSSSQGEVAEPPALTALAAVSALLVPTTMKRLMLARRLIAVVCNRSRRYQ